MRLKRSEFAEMEKLLKKFCADGGYSYEERELNHPVYQLGMITGPNFRIIAYPHRTTALNYHIRLRDSGSASKEIFKATVKAIYESKPFVHDCTFTTKHFEEIR